MCVCFKRPNTLLAPDTFKYMVLSYNKTQRPEVHFASFLCKKQPQYEQIRKTEKHTSNRTLIGKTQYKDTRTIFKVHFMTRGTEK